MTSCFVAQCSSCRHSYASWSFCLLLVLLLVLLLLFSLTQAWFQIHNNNLLCTSNSKRCKIQWRWRMKERWTNKRRKSQSGSMSSKGLRSGTVLSYLRTWRVGRATLDNLGRYAEATAHDAAVRSTLYLSFIKPQGHFDMYATSCVPIF